ncbi:MAG TPA: hypothetical protein VJB89_02330 [Candidatus Nanoarchaeia archaeon]|nr:hypothetical protein [Candidatus Nanoarchaeia archaeon]
MFKRTSKKLTTEEIKKIKTYIKLIYLWFKSKKEPEELIIEQANKLYTNKIEERRIIINILNELIPLLERYKYSLKKEIEIATKILKK